MSVSRTQSVRRLQFALAAAVILLGGVYLLKRATPYGLGLVNDSAAYLGGAEALLQGRGFSRPTAGGADAAIVHFPPGYTWLLSAILTLGVDPFVGARLAGLGLFATGIAFFGLLCRALTSSWKAALFGAALFAAWSTGIRLYSFALSEPLFFAAMMATLLALGRFDATGRARWLVAAGFASGAAALTRYIGLTLIAAATLTLLAFERGRQTAVRVVVYLAPALVPIGAWLIYNAGQAGSAVNRALAWHPITAQELNAGLRSWPGWILPIDLVVASSAEAFPAAVAWALLIGVSLLAFVPRRGRPPLSATLGIFALSYLVGLAATITLLDASTPLDARLLSPVLVVWLALLVEALARLARDRRAGIRLAAAAAGATWLALSLSQGFRTVSELEVGGQGFAALSWQNSRALGALRQLPQDIVVYTNRQSALILLAGLPSYVAPTPVNPATRLPREDYAADLSTMRSRLLAGEAVLALFAVADLTDPSDLAWVAELTDGIPILAEYNDATLYGRP